MANTIKVEVVSAEGPVFEGQAELLVAAAEMGEIGVAAGHAPFLSRLKPGDVRVINADAQEQHFYISGGMIEVQPECVTVLADTAVRAEDLDEAQAIQAKERAERLLADRQSTVDYAEAQLELAQAAAQLSAIRKLKKH